MPGRYGAMSIASGALSAEQAALDATTNNVANVNTPGYSRLRPVLAENDPVVLGSVTFGMGVSLQKLESLRDPILQRRIQEETGQQGHLNALVTAMRQAQVQFTSSSSDIGTEISNFFRSLDQLSTDPTNLSLRQGVLTAASNMASAFNNTANNLIQQRSNLDLNVGQDVAQVNTLSSQIATLNLRISELQGVNQDASAFVDQRDVLIGQLSNLIDVSTIQSDDGLTLTTSNGTALVVGGQSFSLCTKTNRSGLQDVYDSQGKDISANLTSGELAGLLEMRDQKLPGILANLDTLAAGLANGINAAHQGGYDSNGNPIGGFDLNGDPGGNLFVIPPLSGQGAAAALKVQITDPALIAASSDPTASGSNGNIAALSAVQDQSVAGGQTPTDYYASLVFDVGNEVATNSAELNSSQLILTQLNDQRGSISGVSLNEEAANMLQYQNAFDAAARVVTTINEMPRSCAEADVLQKVVSLNQIPEQIMQATRYRRHV